MNENDSKEGGGLIEDGDDHGQAEDLKNDDEEIEKGTGVSLVLLW